MGPKYTTFYNHNTDISIEDSLWDKFPTKDQPYNKYKYAGFKVMRDNSLRKIQRKTYGVLEWLADIGGISRAIFAIGQILMSPLGTF